MGCERPDKWQYKRLSEICDVINYGYTQSASKDPIGPTFLRITDIQRDWIDWSRVPYCQISESDKDKYILNEGDIVIARTGASTGQNAYISNHPEAVFASYLVRLKINESHNSRYVSYFLRSQFYKDFIEGVIGGSAQPNASAKTLTLAKLLLPPLPEQQKIASILSTFDDKIEFNNEMNRTLEEMASAIFKSWFVDFEPFQDGEFEYSEELEKEIPKGWEVASVDELCESIVNGGTPRREVKEYWDDGTVPWIKTGELLDSVIIDSEEKITESGVKNSSAKKLPINTVLIALYASPTVGQLGILKIPATTNQACSALIAKKGVGYIFLYYTLFFQRAHLHQIAVGSAQQNISQKIIRDLRVLLPPKEILTDFNKLVGSFYDKITENSLESKTLAKIRDSLLPKLLSGEIRVFENQKIKEGALV